MNAPSKLLPLMLVLPVLASAQTRHFPLESVQGVRLHNVTAEPATLEGKRGIRVTISSEGAQRAREQRPDSPDLPQLVIIDGLEFSDGVIEAEIAGAVAPNAGEGARGFVGIAFRLQNDMQTYDAFYLRPTNGRVDDQERRNRSTQYISHPEWTWFRLRRETPGRYESYADLEPGRWTKVRIEVQGTRARLFVHDHDQPVLIVNDVKSGATAKGAVALWLGPGTVAHVRNLTVRTGADARIGARDGRPTTGTLPAIVEACWRAEGTGTNHNSDLDQSVGRFRADVRTRWCRATLHAGGRIERRGARDQFATIDSLVMRLSTDTLTAELRERPGAAPQLVVNGRPAPAGWWQGEARARVLRFAKVPWP